MTQDPDQEVIDLIDGIADDLRGNRPQPGSRRSGRSAGAMLSGNPLAVGGVVVLVFLLVVLFFFRSGSGISTNQLKAIEEKLAPMDERLKRIEENLGRFSILVKETEKTRQDIDYMKKVVTGLKKELSRTGNKITALQKKTTSPATRPPASAKALQKKYHTVRSGDTLSRIANKYGLALADLRRLNSNLGEKGLIYPGQKLLVGPP